MPAHSETIFRALSKAIFLAAGVFLLFWFFEAARLALLFFAVAFILALALNPPVVWLEKRGIGRVWGTLLVTLAAFLLTAGISYLVVPRLVTDVTKLVGDVPDLMDRLNRRALRLLENYPHAQQTINDFFANDRQVMSRFAPLVQQLLARVGGYTLSLLGALFLGALLITTVVYTLAYPAPLLKSYITLFPQRLHREAHAAFVRSSQSVSGWLWSNVIVGAIEAALAGVALTILGVPGALVWAALTFFAELVPQAGAYLMMIPPVLVALAVDPMMALWVWLFYLVMMQVVSNAVAPVIRSSQMKLHPASLLFSVLAMGLAFGALGALIATPVAGIFKSFYEEFFVSKRTQPSDECVRAMLEGKMPEPGHPEEIVFEPDVKDVKRAV